MVLGMRPEGAAGAGVGLWVWTEGEGWSNLWQELASARDIGLWACGLVGLWISFKILDVARLMNSSMISATSSMDALLF